MASFISISIYPSKQPAPFQVLQASCISLRHKHGAMIAIFESLIIPTLFILIHFNWAPVINF
jgi:hypothetical protein